MTKSISFDKKLEIYDLRFFLRADILFICCQLNMEEAAHKHDFR